MWCGCWTGGWMERIEAGREVPHGRCNDTYALGITMAFGGADLV